MSVCDRARVVYSEAASLLRKHSTILGEKESSLNALRAKKDSILSENKELSRYMDAQVIQEITSRHDAIVYAKKNVESLREQHAEKLKAFNEAKTLSDRRQRLLDFYSSVLDDVTQVYISRLEVSINEVYQYVFQRPEKRVALEMDDKYNKKVLVIRMFNTVNGKEYPEDLGESGYSVSVVLGTVLLVYFIMYTGLERVIMFDESISGLSVDVSGRFFDLLHVFKERQGFVFGLISHETRYLEFADHVYTMKAGSFLKDR